MDQRTSPTRRSCRIYFNNLPPHRKSEIISRRDWTISTSLSNLPRTRRRLSGRRGHISNEGIAQADDSDVGEEEDSDDEDEDNNHLNFL